MMVTGGGGRNTSSGGYDIEPTVSLEMDNEHVIAQEEYFG